MSTEISCMKNDFVLHLNFKHISIESRMRNIIGGYPNLPFYINRDIGFISMKTLNSTNLLATVLMLTQCTIFTHHHFLCSSADILRNILGHQIEQAYMITVIMGIENCIRILCKSDYISFIQLFSSAIRQVDTKVDKYFRIIISDFSDTSSDLMRTTVNGYSHKPDNK